jgi:hypothetical protein
MKPPPSRPISRLLAAFGILWLLASATHAQTTFSFHFNNSGSDNNSSIHNWSTSVGAAGTIANTIADGSAISSGNGLAAIPGESSLKGFAFYVPATDSAPGASLIHTTSLASSNTFQGVQNQWFRSGSGELTDATVADLTGLRIHTRAQDTTAEMRFAILVDGAWYASESTFSQSSNANWELKSVAPNAINWISGIGTPGSDLDTDLSDNPSAPLAGAGTVTGFGIYTDTGTTLGTSARVRIDTYQVVSTLNGAPPVPTSIVVSPSSVTLNPLGAQSFTAVLNDQYGQPVVPQPTFSWSVSGGGTIDSAGLLAVGTENGSFTVSAEAESLAGNATFNVSPVTGVTTFSAFFNNGTGSAGDKTAAVYNWAAAVGAPATIINSPATVAGVSQGANNPQVPLVTDASTPAGFVFYVPATGVAPGAFLLYRDTLATLDTLQDAPQGAWHRSGNASFNGLTLAAIDQLSFYSSCPSTSTSLRLAIKVGSQWYASETSFNPSAANTWEPFAINPASALWITGVGTPGTALDIDLTDNGPAASLPGTSIISGYGVYAFTDALEGNNARVRIDSFQVSTIDFGGASDGYTAWTESDFTNPFLDTAPESDPDHDGLTNLLEFVLGGDPTISQGGIQPAVASATGDDLVITFRRSEAALLDGIEVRVQLSDDLSTWDSADEILIDANSGTGPNGTSYTVTIDSETNLDLIEVTIPKGVATRKFARVTASQAQP